MPMYSPTGGGGMHIPSEEVALMQSPMGAMPLAGAPMMAPMPPQLASPLQAPVGETRLAVGVSKAVSEATLQRLFSSIPSMLSCELTRDHTGQSRVRACPHVLQADRQGCAA